MNVTALIPWHGRQRDLLDAAILSLPKGMPFLVAQNEGKHEMHHALNAALDDVETPLVFIMGADDLVGEDCIQLLEAAIGTADVAYPMMKLFGAVESEFHAEAFSLHRMQERNMVPGAFLARTDTLRRVLWRNCPFEDYDLHYRIAQQGGRFEAVPKAVYHYRIHDASWSNEVYQAGITHEEITREIVGEATPMVATFYQCASPAVDYVRATLPARVLPGVTRSTWDSRRTFATPLAVIEHATSEWDEVIAGLRAEDASVFVDVDDNYLTPRLVPRMAEFRSWHPEPEAVDANCKAWTELQPSHRRIVAEADGVIAATPTLAEAYAKVNDNVHVCLNSVDPADWSEMHPLRLDEKLRIGWPAGVQHGPDAYLVEPALRWASEQPNVEVVCMGLDPQFSFDYHHEPFTASGQVYRDILSLLDVVVCPVRGGVMDACKSDLKWLEATMAGAACIVSDRPAYRFDTGHGVPADCALKAKTPRDFLRAMRELVADDDLRISLAGRSLGYVSQFRTNHAVRPAYLAAAESVGAISMEVAA